LVDHNVRRRPFASAVFGVCACAIAAFVALMSTFGYAADASDAAAAENAPVRLLVLDLELVGDLGDPSMAPQHEARIQMASEKLRGELAQLAGYVIVDETPAQEQIANLRSLQHLHQCNGCELDIARELTADRVFVAWIHRVSLLILTLKYEIRDVATGKPVLRKAFDFRGDTDAGWSRAIEYMVRDMQSDSAAMKGGG
jgi:hypothetical protein